MSQTSEIRENACLCYQCGKCSAGCPVAEDMEVLPHRVMHYVGMGMDEKVLDKNTIWMCAGCFTCAVRCPNDIDITSIMDDLRRKALNKGSKCAVPSVKTFHETFINDFCRRGRVHELRMMGEYNMKSGHPLHNASLAPKMLLRHRLHVLPPRTVKGFKKWIRRLLKRS